MFDVDGTPLYTLDFSDFHECDERRELIKALTGISDLDYRLFSEEEMKEYEQKITVVYTNEEHFSNYFHGEKLIERKPMYRKKPYIQKQIFIKCPSAQQMITDDFSDYEEKIAIQEVDRVTEYRSEEAFIMDSKPKFLSILKGAAIKRDNELIQALIRS